MITEYDIWTWKKLPVSQNLYRSFQHFDVELQLPFTRNNELENVKLRTTKLLLRPCEIGTQFRKLKPGNTKETVK